MASQRLREAVLIGCNRRDPARATQDAQRDVKAREQILIALFNALPAHLHGALSELRTVTELVGAGHADGPNHHAQPCQSVSVMPHVFTRRTRGSA